MQNQPLLSSSMNSDAILLDVSGIKFRTQINTLARSDYFMSLMIKWESGSYQQEDGSYFVDADPDIFQHVLNFMRRPLRFPLFWTKETGFDYVLYNKLEAEANFFLLDDLWSWIQKKKYLGAVILGCSIERHALEDSDYYHTGDATVTTYVEDKGAKGGYFCPRARHNFPIDCNAECVAAGGKRGLWEAPTKYVIIVTQTIQFDNNVCLNTRA